jgi:glyoxylase-like metal-dependent hydrolase (beta-lactamase superfamily II)
MVTVWRGLSQMEIGNIRIEPVFDGTFTSPAKDVLRQPGNEDAWSAHQDLLNDRNELVMPVGGFLIRTRDRLVLLDTGLGPISNASTQSGDLLNSLRDAGVAPDDVTDVVLTHLHGDHIGWVTQQNKVVFPRATYRCHARDWELFVTSPDARKHCACMECWGQRPCDGTIRKLSPFSAQLELFDGDTEVADGISVRDAPGHTPGSSVVIVSSGTDRAFLLGDVAHCPIELTELEWEGVYDIDPDLARKTREALLRELEGRDIPVAAAHFEGMQFGRVLQGSGKRQWVFD